MSLSSARFIPHTEDDVRLMLAAIGVADLDALFASVPEKLRLARKLAVPQLASEQDEVGPDEPRRSQQALNALVPNYRSGW